jgi:hypothetical protein
MLVALGEFLGQYGLIDEMMQVPIGQKTYRFTPQSKLVEFLAGILSGMERLQDLNDGAQPVAKDAVVARAWGRLALLTTVGSVGRWKPAMRKRSVRWKE